jgi:hypothetical protein
LGPHPRLIAGGYRFALALVGLAAFALVLIGASATAASGPIHGAENLRDPIDWAALAHSRDAENARRNELEARRNRPEERAKRGHSRHAFSNVSDAEALKVARDTHGELMNAPLWEPVPLRGGERVSRHLGESAAVVKDSSGKAGVYESALPLLSRSESGALEPTDLKLIRKGTAVVPTNPVVPLTIGGKLGAGTSFDGTGVELRVDGDPAAPATLTDDKVFYANIRRDTDVVVTPQPLGAETVFTLRSADSPEQQTMHFTLRDGAALKPGPGGGLEIARGDTHLATVAPPAAWDADGVAIKTSYELSGNDVIVHVEHQGGDYVYPIAVDPQVYWDYRNWNTNSSLGDNGWRFLTPYPSQFQSLHLYPTWYGRGDYVKTPRAWVHYNGGEWASWDLWAPVGAYIFRVDFNNGHYDPSVPGSTRPPRRSPARTMASASAQ